MRKIVSFFILLLLGSSFACRKPAETGHLVRLIDRLSSQNILASPFQDPETAAFQDVFCPVHSFPLIDEGSGENPFGLKKKMHGGGVDMNILFSPPRSEFGFDMEKGEGWKLDFGIGIYQDANSEKVREKFQGMRERVVFEVFIETSGWSQAVFTKSVIVPLPRPESHMVSSQHSLSLPVLKEPARLALRTKGAPRAFAFWSNPVLYRSKEGPLNVILVSLDTLRSDHLGCYGYGRPTSPNIDSLAGDAVLFRRAYAPSPWTLPSHVSLLTGLRTYDHKVGTPEDRMDPAIVTLADVLRRHGLFCAAFTEGGFVSPRYGFSKGFDYYSEADGIISFPLSAGQLASSALRWLEQHARRPFFLFLHTYQPHDPYISPPPYNRMFLPEGAEWKELDLLNFLGSGVSVFRPLTEAQRQNIIGLYDGEIRFTDEILIGPLMETLKRLGLYERTLLIVTSDHGEEFYEHGAWLHTNQLYEESIRVPLLVKFPGSRFRGRKVEGAVRLIDIAPTILDVLNIDKTPAAWQGTSLLVAARAGRAENHPVLAEMGKFTLLPAKKCLIENGNKLIRNDAFRAEELAQFKFQPPLRPALELYTLDSDPGEKSNLIDKEPDLVRRMAALLQGIIDNAPRRDKHRMEMDPALRERLRALGYLR